MSGFSEKPIPFSSFRKFSGKTEIRGESVAEDKRAENKNREDGNESSDSKEFSRKGNNVRGLLGSLLGIFG